MTDNNIPSYVLNDPLVIESGMLNKSISTKKKQYILEIENEYLRRLMWRNNDFSTPPNPNLVNLSDEDVIQTIIEDTLKRSKVFNEFQTYNYVQNDNIFKEVIECRNKGLQLNIEQDAINEYGRRILRRNNVNDPFTRLPYINKYSNSSDIDLQDYLYHCLQVAKDSAKNLNRTQFAQQNYPQDRPVPQYIRNDPILNYYFGGGERQIVDTPYFALQRLGRANKHH